MASGRWACEEDTSTNRPDASRSGGRNARDALRSVSMSSERRNSQSSSGVSSIAVPPRQPPTRCSNASTRPNFVDQRVHPCLRGGGVQQVDRLAVVDPAVGQRVGVAVDSGDGVSVLLQPLDDHRPQAAPGAGHRDNAHAATVSTSSFCFSEL